MTGMRDAPETFGQTIRRLRERRNLSQERLEALVGYAPGSGMVSQIESGERGKRLPLSKLAAFAQALGVPIEVILEAAGKMTPMQAAELAVRPSFEDFVNSDIRLRVEQKRMLVALYRSYVPSSSSSGGG